MGLVDASKMLDVICHNQYDDSGVDLTMVDYLETLGIKEKVDALS
jgi:hypothetical protein